MDLLKCVWNQTNSDAYAAKVHVIIAYFHVWELWQNNALAFDFDAYLTHCPILFVHLTHQNLSAHALCGYNSLAKCVDTQLLFNVLSLMG